jgi:hypothetical protein
MWEEGLLRGIKSSRYMRWMGLNIVLRIELLMGREILRRLLCEGYWRGFLIRGGRC